MAGAHVSIHRLAARIAAIRISLRPYLSALQSGIVLAPDQASHAASLLAEIAEAKAEFVALGGDPSLLAKQPNSKPKRTNQKSGFKKLVGRRKGGAGVYGMGSTTRFWS
jgi:hypothetical protein